MTQQNLSLEALSPGNLAVLSWKAEKKKLKLIKAFTITKKNQRVVPFLHYLVFSDHKESNNSAGSKKKKKRSHPNDCIISAGAGKRQETIQSNVRMTVIFDGCLLCVLTLPPLPHVSVHKMVSIKVDKRFSFFLKDCSDMLRKHHTRFSSMLNVYFRLQNEDTLGGHQEGAKHWISFFPLEEKLRSV